MALTAKIAIGTLFNVALRRWLMVACCLIGACSRPPEPILRVATNVWPGYELLYLARSLGYYEQSSIRLVEMQSASQVLQALGNGTAEAAAVTLDEALTVMQNSTDELRVVLVIDISDGADGLLSREQITDLSGLRGKRIGVENTATGALMLDAALERAGLRSQDIRIVPKTVNDHLYAWNKHEVDAIVTFEPIRSQLLKAGAQEVFNSSQIPGRILDVLVVRTEALQRCRDSLQTLVAGYFSARQYWQRHPEDAAKRMAPRLKAEPEQVALLFQGLKFPDLAENRQWLAGNAPKLVASAVDIAKLMRERQLLQFQADLGSLADAGLLPEQEP